MRTLWYENEMFVFILFMGELMDGEGYLLLPIWTMQVFVVYKNM